MRTCQRCKRYYRDNSLRFCLEDGTPLTELSENEFKEVADTLIMGDTIYGPLNPNMNIKILRKKKEFNICTVFYPQIKGHPNSSVETRINAFLRRQFFEDQEDDEDVLWENCAAISELGMTEDAVEQSDESLVFTPTIETAQGVSFKTGLNNNEVLSIKYLWWATGGVHPISNHKAFTIELQTGYVFHFEDLFINGSHYLPIINNLILKSLKEQKHPLDFTEKREYDFYLTKKHLVIFNLFDYEAARTLEAFIKPSEMAYIINQGGPLYTFLK